MPIAKESKATIGIGYFVQNFRTKFQVPDTLATIIIKLIICGFLNAQKDQPTSAKTPVEAIGIDINVKIAV
ncbi:MAG: hypothetical protein COT09_01060 [Candidatus Hydromicrobium americanum]|nr:MAG: hypothetical protein COT09_01060 [Candidatus Hydromicrobium americanum]